MCRGKHEGDWRTVPVWQYGPEPRTMVCRTIDMCIADLVNALNQGGIVTNGSCCGHPLTSSPEKQQGDIFLDDGRTLLVLDREMSELYRERQFPSIMELLK